MSACLIKFMLTCTSYQCIYIEMSVEEVIKNSCQSIGEGPHWDDRTNTLLYVDILSNDVHRWNPDTGNDEKIHLGTYM